MFTPHKQRRLLIDCNSFFASCEIMRNPTLRGKPVVVGKDIILAASYEAKFFGVYTGMPIREAKKNLPKGTVYCGMDIVRYADVSKRLLAFLRDKFPIVLPASIDESFIRCDEYVNKTDQEWEEYILELQQDILHHVGVPVSIGVSSTKLLAKMAADYKKPLGYTIVCTQVSIDKLLSDLSIHEIPFVGSETAEKLSPYVKTALGYSKLSLSQIKSLLGHHGVKIRYELHGISLSITQLKRSIPGGIGRTRSFNPDFTNDPTILWNHVQNNLTRARKELYAKNLGTSLISVSVKSKDFKKYSIKKKLPHYINDFGLLMSTARSLFDDILLEREVYGVLLRATGVSFRNISSINNNQPGLFSHIEDEKNKQLNKTLFGLHKRYGKSAVHLGTYALKEKSRKVRVPKIFGISK